MHPVLRRVLYVITYEVFAVVLATLGLSAFTGQPLGHTGVITVIVSTIAVAWNFVFNTLFEAWESRQSVRGRSFARRAAHAVGFELGLTAAIVPLFAWWLDVSYLEALLYDITLLVFFLFYTFAFNFGFDRVFGLPVSAR